MIVPAVRFEGDDHVRLHVCNDSADGRFDVEHVHVREGVRQVAAALGMTIGIRDTRKTTPGLRALEKYAVRCGGGCF